MPKILNALEFKSKIGSHIKDLTDEEFLFIANESNYRNSFVVIKPDYFIRLLSLSGEDSLVDLVRSIIISLKEKISIKYRNVVRNRWS